jgi:hypothetical protein
MVRRGESSPQTNAFLEIVRYVFLANNVTVRCNEDVFYKVLQLADVALPRILFKISHRLTLRGKIKVNIRWLLNCMIHNIEKIANYGFA